MRAGDYVPYVICKDDSVTSFAQRAWDPDSVEAANGAISIDKKWYLESQLHPVISRLCAGECCVLPRVSYLDLQPHNLGD